MIGVMRLPPNISRKNRAGEHMRAKGRRMAAKAAPKPRRTAAQLERQLDKLASELRECAAERDEALAQQAAAAEVLQVINASPGDLQPVFEAILDKAIHLCGAACGTVGIWQADRFAPLAFRCPQPLAGYYRTNEIWFGPREGFARVAAGEGYVQIPDLPASKFYRE